MSDALVWDGQGSVRKAQEDLAPTPGQVLVAVSHSLFEPGSPSRCLSALATVLHSETPQSPPVGSTLCFATRRFASRQVVPLAQCLAVNDLTTEQALLVPVVAGILRMMETLGADLGWTAVVNGDDFVAQLIRRLAHHAGARQILSSRSGKHLAGPTGDAAAVTEATLQQALSAISGSVVAIDTTSRPSDIQNLLSALPALNTCALYGPSSGGVSAVNFYLDVHRKNIQIVGNSAHLQPEHLNRAHEFVRCGRIAAAGMTTVLAQRDHVPAQSEANPQILEWN